MTSNQATERTADRCIVIRCERDGAAMPERNGHKFIYEDRTVRLETAKL